MSICVEFYVQELNYFSAVYETQLSNTCNLTVEAKKGFQVLLTQRSPFIPFAVNRGKI